MQCPDPVPFREPVVRVHLALECFREGGFIDFGVCDGDRFGRSPSRG